MPSPLIVQSSLHPYIPACGYKFHVIAVYAHPTFTAPFQSEMHLKSSRTSATELFAEIVDVFRP